MISHRLSPVQGVVPENEHVAGFEHRDLRTARIIPVNLFVGRIVMDCVVDGPIAQRQV